MFSWQKISWLLTKIKNVNPQPPTDFDNKLAKIIETVAGTWTLGSSWGEGTSYIWILLIVKYDVSWSLTL